MKIYHIPQPMPSVIYFIVGITEAQFKKEREDGGRIEIINKNRSQSYHKNKVDRGYRFVYTMYFGNRPNN